MFIVKIYNNIINVFFKKFTLKTPPPIPARQEQIAKANPTTNPTIVKGSNGKIP